MSSTNRLPNFLVVGAAKSGTTSLYYYLSQHPEIYMSEMKEPDYFASPNWNLPMRSVNGNAQLEVIDDYNEYLTLFKEAGTNQITGEASPSTLYYYQDSVPLIKAKIDNPKIIILLRNPVKRAFSHYAYFKTDNKENVSFEKALELEEERIAKNFHYGYHYKHLGFYYRQVRSFLEEFKEVKIVLFNDLVNKPDEVMRDVFTFLNVDPSFNPELNVVHNPSGNPRLNALHTFIRNKNRFRDAIRPVVDKMLSPQKKAEIMAKINQFNLKKNESLNSSTKEALLEEFDSDIHKLEKLTGMDLSYWRA